MARRSASSVRLVRMTVGAADEYRDLSKDGTGAYRKGLKGHKGQIVYSDKKHKLRVRPVYTFESVREVREDVITKFGKDAIKGFFQSGCLVEILSAVAHDLTPLPPGKYKLNTIFTDGRARVTNSSGKLSLPIGLEKLLVAGFRRAN